ncbi:MAG TPA: DUF2318 domain-containing protein [Blastocatellia bacterium]|nr:DUF2318 domain-containing protein [Blastocatellia bacterium]
MQNQTREKKREQFSGNTKSKSKAWIIIPALIAVALGVYVVFNASSDKPSSSTVTTTNQAASGNQASGNQASDVRIPISDISAKAKFFDYNTADKRSVRFFVMKSSDGVYRAALDACDTCYHAKKGYHQEGDEMICNNCGLKFHSSLINKVAGGCNPIGIANAIEGDQIVIKASDLERGGRFF